MNIPLLRKVQEAIASDPARFDMIFFVGHGPCGTTACIAGWAVALDRHIDLDTMKSGGIGHGAESALALRYVQSLNLFYVTRWPEEFENAYKAAETDAARAAAAVRRIEHLIQSGT